MRVLAAGFCYHQDFPLLPFVERTAASFPPSVSHEISPRFLRGGAVAYARGGFADSG